MRVLLVEDHSTYAGLVRRELESGFGHEVVMAADPTQAAEHLAAATFDVVVVDVLYEPLIRDFNSRRLARRVLPTSGPLLLSGLAVLRAAADGAVPAGAVVWTSGETNRHLHLLYAYEELDVRVFCSKTSGAGTVESLDNAIRAATDRRAHVDQLLNPYLPTGDGVTLRRTLLREPGRRAIWRAIALGHYTRREISRITGYSERHIGNTVPLMVSEDLQLLDPGLRPGRSALGELIRYATHNWEFLLDDTVRDMYP